MGRFDYYKPSGDIGVPEEVGLLPCDMDYELGTPNFKRNENYTFVASNSALKECMVLRLKWRPDGAASNQQVTLISKLNLTLDGQTYEFFEVDIYRPSESPLRPGVICQYGSRNLKVFVQSPYRRVRISFNGHMRQTVTGSYLFIKFSCVLNPFSQIFDFYALPRGDLLHHDRHEQRMRFNGEYSLVVDGGEGRRKLKTFVMWGYQVRHFLSSPPLADSQYNHLKTKRLYVHMNNGQGFQIGTIKSPAGETRDFGFTAFDIRPNIDLIKTPYKFNLGNFNEDNNNNDNDDDNDEPMDKFDIEISGQKCIFQCKGERYLANWFRCEMNGKSGWAWLSQDDELTESQGELEAVERARCELELASKLGKICQQQVVAGSELDQSRKLVVSIDQECCRSSELVGAKAASLAQLLEFTRHKGSDDETKQAIIVPYGFVLTRFAHDLILADNVDLREAIDELTRFVAEMGAKTSDDLGATHLAQQLRDECKKVEQLVTQTKLPRAIADEFWSKLQDRYDNLGRCTTGSDDNCQPAACSAPLFAVRSSSWGEDEADMSAAGQLTTVLNVKPTHDELAAAIMQCFASKFSSENVEYKRQHGQPLDMPMAVVIQEMVACDRAGVMFTCDPTTGDESAIIITANYGLGESVVSAQADPDSVRVRVSANLQEPAPQPRLEIEQVSIGKKQVVVQSEASAVSNQHQDKSKCCLADEEIITLAKSGLAISYYFWSQRRDIEFGFLGSQLYLFQSRPVTGLEAMTQEELVHESERPNSAERCCYSRANIGEVMPYAVLPFTQTYNIFAWNIVGYSLISKFSNDIIYAPQVSADVLQEKYHAFFSVRCSMLFSIAEEQKSVLGKSMEIGFFGRELGHQPEIIEASRGFVKPPNVFQGFWYQFYTTPLRVAPKRVILRQYPIIRQLREQVRAKKLAMGYETHKLEGLFKQMQLAMRGMRPCWDNHIHLVTMASNANVVLSAVLAQYIKDPMQLSAATNKFLAISPDVVSAEIPRRVRQMAELLVDAGNREHFASMSPDEALAYLQSNDGGSGGGGGGGGASVELRKAYEDFIANFGHRCYNEFEMGTLSWREDPKQVVEMIQKNCSSETTGVTQQKQRPQTIEAVIESLGVEMTLKDKLLVRHVLAPKCQLLLSMRERTKDILVMFTDVLREATRQLAEELVRQLRLPDRDLFYYLMYEEVAPLVRGHQPTLVMQAARRRQMFKRTFSEPWKFEEIIWDIVPNHMKPMRELDEAIAQAPRLSGTPASSGKVQGRVCLVSGYKELDRVKAGTILVTHSTDIAFSPVFPLISGIITEVGGLISHGAVVAREYGLPSVIGIPDVCMILQDGEEILLDADNGAIVRLSKQNIGQSD